MTTTTTHPGYAPPPPPNTYAPPPPSNERRDDTSTDLDLNLLANAAFTDFDDAIEPRSWTSSSDSGLIFTVPHPQRRGVNVISEEPGSEISLAQAIAGGVQEGQRYAVSIEVSQPDTGAECQVRVEVGEETIVAAMPGVRAGSFSGVWTALKDSDAQDIRVVAGGCTGVPGENQVVHIGKVSVQKVPDEKTEVKV